jgi:hypothetical protein
MKKIYGFLLILAGAMGIGLVITQKTGGAAPAAAQTEVDFKLTPEEEAEYQQLAAQNAKAREVFQDLKDIAVLSREFFKGLPEKKTLAGVTLTIKDPATATIGALYNIAEIGLKIIDIIEERGALLSTSACMKYGDDELQSVVDFIEKQGIMKDLEKCTQEKNPKAVDACFKAYADKYNIPAERLKCPFYGCKMKKSCGARATRMVVSYVKSIFDSALVKWNFEKNQGERGLLLNVDVILTAILDLVFQMLLKDKGSISEIAVKVENRTQADDIAQKTEQAKGDLKKIAAQENLDIVTVISEKQPTSENQPPKDVLDALAEVETSKLPFVGMIRVDENWWVYSKTQDAEMAVQAKGQVQAGALVQEARASGLKKIAEDKGLSVITVGSSKDVSSPKQAPKEVIEALAEVTEFSKLPFVAKVQSGKDWWVVAKAKQALSDALQKANTFYLRINALKSGLALIGQSISGLLEAMILVTGVVDKDAIAPEEKKRLEEQFKEAQKIVIKDVKKAWENLEGLAE